MSYEYHMLQVCSKKKLADVPNAINTIHFTDIPLRLQGPSRDYGVGRVEIFYKGQWGTVCNDHWDLNDATVACHQLGYKYGNDISIGRLVPAGFGEIWLNDVECTGREQNLSSCSHSGWGNNDCNHHGDAGVECFSTGKSLYFIADVEICLYIPSV